MSNININIEKCPACAAEISSQAKTCPQCGHQILRGFLEKYKVKGLSLGCLWVFLLHGLLLVVVLYGFLFLMFTSVGVKMFKEFKESPSRYAKATTCIKDFCDSMPVDHPDRVACADKCYDRYLPREDKSLPKENDLKKK